MSPRSAVLGALLALAAVGCDREAPPARSGPFPAVRCAGLQPTEPPATLGGFHLETESHVLRVKRTAGKEAPWRILLLAGPAPGRRLPAGATGAVRASQADLVLSLGDVGDDPATARSTLQALAAAGRPVLVLPGGRDEPEVLAEASADLAHVLPLTGWHVLQPSGAPPLVLLPGAPPSAPARSKRACGHDALDVEQTAASARRVTARGRPWVLAWAAPLQPAGPSTDRLGPLGAEGGARTTRRLVEQLRACGWVAAWPRGVGRRVGAPEKGCDGGLLLPAWSRAAGRTPDGTLRPPPASPPVWLLASSETGWQLRSISKQ